jgi:hypothetical protein
MSGQLVSEGVQSIRGRHAVLPKDCARTVLGAGAFWVHLLAQEVPFHLTGLSFRRLRRTVQVSDSAFATHANVEMLFQHA